MNIYQVSCRGDGSYFMSYLQSVTVSADTEEGAIKIVESYFEKSGESFIHPKERTVIDKQTTYPDYKNTFRKNPVIITKERVVKWDINLLVENLQNNMVIDTHSDSDY